MKTRYGFVSNSSSSSFLIVGTRRNVSNILESMGWQRDEYAYGGFSNWECSECGIYNDGDYTVAGNYEPFYVGLDAAPRFKKGMTYRDIVAELASMMYSDYGIIIDYADIDLFYGEVGNG